MKKFRLSAVVVFAGILIWSCNQKPKTLYTLLSERESGIDFSNDILETDSFNILTYEYIYNGGGEGVGDFNNDGLQDIFFCGNMVPNKLYLNEGGLKFRDVSEKAKIAGGGKWNSGVSVVDINNDGLLDIYVTATLKKDSASRRNMLFVNQGADPSGNPVFEDQAARYGIDYGGYSVMSAFFDYDRDGDLDLYILTNVKINNRPTTYREKIVDGSAPNNDKLFRNNGNGTFTDVTLQAGIKEEGFGLGLAIADFTSDGYPDLYVSNDYLSNDILYINNKNGTFTNATAKLLGHQSQFSMGNDAADFNNDGKPDLITLDMLPENNDRIKTTISNKSYQNYINNERFGYQYQYVRNMLQLNNGTGDGIKFSEIGQLSGIYQTEWSWSPLFMDVDNDGWKDLLITNGFPKDITDKDFANYRNDVGQLVSVRYLLDSIPVVKIPNYAFKNNGNLTFTDVSQSWGINTPSFSNGAAFADFDNDGDLDYAVNNINGVAFLYKNNLYEKDKVPTTSYLDVQLIGSPSNRNAYGAKVTIFAEHQIQYSELNPYRGFLSSVESSVHFGTGSSARVDSIRIDWPDGKVSRLGETKANQKIKIDYTTVTKNDSHSTKPSTDQKLFHDVAQALKLAIRHEEEDQNDFNIQRTLPHKFSQSGPGIAVGDINGDGLEDLIIGGSSNHPTMSFTQNSKGTFNAGRKIQTGDKPEEDEGLLLFDADNDNDLDLYVVGGGFAPSGYTTLSQDHLYLNDGAGNFKDTKLPASSSSGSCVRAADFDGDGDLDLFVGGRVVAGGYPMAAESYLFQNNEGQFTDVTDQLAPGMKKLGMVTDALWTDYNNDGTSDLMIVGEFMAIRFFKNVKGEFSPDPNTGLENYLGWWNSIAAGDFDRDGDVDYVVGNLGENNNYHVAPGNPLKVFAKDFDNNGSIDPLMACYMKESMRSPDKKLFPMHFWDELNTQSPLFRRKFRRYNQYAKTDMEHLLSPAEQKDAVVLEANEMATSFVENIGGGKFVLKKLETLTQVAPVFGIVTGDFNHDGYLDFAMVGNDFGNEVFAGRYDAFTGLVMLGDGKLKFTLAPSSASGFYVPGNAKGLAKLEVNSRTIFVATQNQDSLKVFELARQKPLKTFIPSPSDVCGFLFRKDGTKEKVEFYYGSGYLSQSSRAIPMPQDLDYINVCDTKGAWRKVMP
jgi:hypothetical protein